MPAASAGRIDLGDVLGAVGGHQQRLGARVDGVEGVEQHAHGWRRRPSVAPGSRVSTARSPSRVASSRACVDFPVASPPSKAISITRSARRRWRLCSARSERKASTPAIQMIERAEPQRQPHAGQEDVTAEELDLAVAEDVLGEVVEEVRQERPDGERDQQAQAHDDVQRGEHAAAQLVVDVLVQQREADDVGGPGEHAEADDAHDRRPERRARRRRRQPGAGAEHGR